MAFAAQHTPVDRLAEVHWCLLCLWLGGVGGLFGCVSQSIDWFKVKQAAASLTHHSLIQQRTRRTTLIPRSPIHRDHQPSHVTTTTTTIIIKSSKAGAASPSATPPNSPTAAAPRPHRRHSRKGLARERQRPWWGQQRGRIAAGERRVGDGGRRPGRVGGCGWIAGCMCGWVLGLEGFQVLVGGSVVCIRPTD